jgi:hypothetical protein
MFSIDTTFNSTGDCKKYSQFFTMTQRRKARPWDIFWIKPAVKWEDKNQQARQGHVLLEDVRGVFILLYVLFVKGRGGGWKVGPKKTEERRESK